MAVRDRQPRACSVHGRTEPGGAQARVLVPGGTRLRGAWTGRRRRQNRRWPIHALPLGEGGDRAKGPMGSPHGVYLWRPPRPSNDSFAVSIRNDRALAEDRLPTTRRTRPLHAGRGRASSDDGDGRAGCPRYGTSGSSDGRGSASPDGTAPRVSRRDARARRTASASWSASSRPRARASLKRSVRASWSVTERVDMDESPRRGR